MNQILNLKINDKFNIKLSQEQIDSSIKKSKENSNEKLWDDFREKGILSTVDITQNKSTIKNIVEKIKAPFKPKVKQQSKNQDMER